MATSRPLPLRTTAMTTAHVPAPELREVAATRWDIDDLPVIGWDPDHRHFFLTASSHRVDDVTLVRFASPTDHPRALALALAETVAACDFPATDDHASQPRMQAALRAARIDHPPLADPLTGQP